MRIDDNLIGCFVLVKWGFHMADLDRWSIHWKIGLLTWWPLSKPINTLQARISNTCKQSTLYVHYYAVGDEEHMIHTATFNEWLTILNIFSFYFVLCSNSLMPSWIIDLNFGGWIWRIWLCIHRAFVQREVTQVWPHQENTREQEKLPELE